MAGSLSPSQITAYARDGFLCPLDVLTPGDAAAHRAGLEALEAREGGAMPRPISEYLRMNAHLTTGVSLAQARNPRILDAVESILGPDLMLWSCEYFIKEAGSKSIVSWHQDLTYWGMDGSDHEVTAWLALSPATGESGCMKFVPGSHRTNLVPHTDTFADDNMLSRGQEIAVEVDEADAVVAALQPGQMSLHHGRMFHGSGPNTTDDRRIGFVMRFIRPDTPAIRRDFAMLVRGADRVGNRINLVPPDGPDFSAARLALYEEAQNAVDASLADGLAGTDAMYQQESPANA
ncbi:MAG: phytanoyl-CoA dioxygenase family protein [Pseudomonadota bacterium]